MKVAEEYVRDAIRAEYLREREAYRSLVGRLYPSMSYQRLLELREKFEHAGGDPLQLPYVPPPNREGYAPIFI